MARVKILGDGWHRERVSNVTGGKYFAIRRVRRIANLRGIDRGQLRIRLPHHPVIRGAHVSWAKILADGALRAPKFQVNR